MEDLRVDSGVDESSEEHVAADAGETVEVRDTHDGYCFMAGGDDGRAWSSAAGWLVETFGWRLRKSVLNSGEGSRLVAFPDSIETPAQVLRVHCFAW